MITIIMGVSGAGKTTIGSSLANELGWEFYDADDFHSAENRGKMAKGISLTDADREPWHMSLRNVIENNVERNQSCVLACCALKDANRKKLRVTNNVQFAYLKGSYDLIETRMKNRSGHYMPVALLQSQLEALEEPVDALVIDINHSPAEIIRIIRKGLKL